MPSSDDYASNQEWLKAKLAEGYTVVKHISPYTTKGSKWCSVRRDRFEHDGKVSAMWNEDLRVILCRPDSPHVNDSPWWMANGGPPELVRATLPKPKIDYTAITREIVGR